MSEQQSVPVVFEPKTIAIVHQGLNAKRLREASGISQEYMGKKLKVSQQNVSLLEEKLVMEDRVIDIYVKELGCRREHITNMKTDVPADNTIHLKIEHNDNITFNPLDKLIEFSKDKDELYKQNVLLQEKLVKNEKEKFTIMSDLFNDHKAMTERVLTLISTISEKLS